MSVEEPSAQANDGEGAVQNQGLQARIDELVKKAREAEERERETQQRLVEAAAQQAQMAMQLRSQPPAAPPPAPVDPLAAYKDRLDPVAHDAIQAAVLETQRRMEAQFAPMLAQQAAQIASFAVQAEANKLPGIPPEVITRASERAATWRQNGLSISPEDALLFALGEHQRKQLAKAAPVIGYNPAAAPQAVTPGFAPAPAPAAKSLPANFDSLSRAQQNQLLEQAGLLDTPL